MWMWRGVGRLGRRNRIDKGAAPVADGAAEAHARAASQSPRYAFHRRLLPRRDVRPGSGPRDELERTTRCGGDSDAGMVGVESDWDVPSRRRGGGIGICGLGLGGAAMRPRPPPWCRSYLGSDDGVGAGAWDTYRSFVKTYCDVQGTGGGEGEVEDVMAFRQCRAVNSGKRTRRQLEDGAVPFAISVSDPAVLDAANAATAFHAATTCGIEARPSLVVIAFAGGGGKDEDAPRLRYRDEGRYKTSAKAKGRWWGSSSAAVEFP
ncbi:hypothetical protein C8R45DRAFT_1081202 [Mycena sanguinolenta]|nr:hypothetical protein C8R45DRAFT_1081202 [Mycena sanguinolenta]